MSKLQRIDLMKAIKHGADVYSRSIAMTLRAMASEQPRLVRIMRPRLAPKNGAVRQPYFGAKLTAAGRRALEAARKRNLRESGDLEGKNG